MLSGDKLKSLRIMANISEKDIANAIGKSDRWIRKIESGEEIPTEEVYSDYLNTIYGRKKIPKEKPKPMGHSRS